MDTGAPSFGSASGGPPYQSASAAVGRQGDVGDASGPDRDPGAGVRDIMLARLALFFVIVPLVELALLLRIGQWVGLWPTLALVVVTGVAGAGLARAEGLRTLRAFRRETVAGRLPGRSLLDGLAVLVGGAFLLTPGLLTDIAGFSLLVPTSRRWIQRRVRRWIEGRIEAGEIRVQMRTAGVADRGRGDGLDPANEIRHDVVEER